MAIDLLRRQSGPDDGRDHEDLGPMLNTVFWTMAALSTIFLALRVYTKVSRRRKMWWDDWLLIASWVAFMTSAATTSVCIELDYGKNAWDMDPKNFPKMPFVAVFAGFFSVLAACWSKTSFALTLYRLVHETWIKLLIWFLIITLNAILGTAMLLMWIKCRPIQKIWDDKLPGRCIDPGNIVIVYQWSAGYSGAVDVVLALLPWYILPRMKMTLTKKERFFVAICMSMGVVAGAASFVKMVELPNLKGGAKESVSVTLWGSTEGSLTIIAASIPVLRALIRKDKGRRAPKFDTIDERRLNEVGNTSLDTLQTPCKYTNSTEKDWLHTSTEWEGSQPEQA